MIAKPLRICHVFATFAPGGPQLRIANVLNALSPDIEHAIVAMDGRHNASKHLGEELRLSYPDPERGRWGHLYPLFLTRKLRALKPDLIVTHNWGSMDAGFGAALGLIAPWIHMETGFEADEADRTKQRRNIARRILLARAAAVIVPSENLQHIARNVWRVSQRRLHFIDNGVDCQRFSEDVTSDVRQKLNIPADALVVGSIAQLRAVKDPLKLLAAFAALAERLPNAHLVFVGEGPMREPIVQRSREMGLEQRVHLAGHQADTPQWHAALDVFALSSLSEQNPVSVLEAMATGKPVLGTDVGDLARLVSADNRRYVVAPDDTQAYNEALDTLLGDASLRSDLGARNRERVLNNFQVGTMIEKYEHLYRTVAGTESLLRD